MAHPIPIPGQQPLHTFLKKQSLNHHPLLDDNASIPKSVTHAQLYRKHEESSAFDMPQDGQGARSAGWHKHVQAPEPTRPRPILR